MVWRYHGTELLTAVLIAGAVVVSLWGLLSGLVALIYGGKQRTIRCPECRYNLRGVCGKGCPECGSDLDESGVYGVGQPSHQTLLNMLLLWSLFFSMYGSFAVVYFSYEVRQIEGTIVLSIVYSHPERRSIQFVRHGQGYVWPWEDEAFAVTGEIEICVEHGEDYSLPSLTYDPATPAGTPSVGFKRWNVEDQQEGENLSDDTLMYHRIRRWLQRNDLNISSATARDTWALAKWMGAHYATASRNSQLDPTPSDFPLNANAYPAISERVSQSLRGVARPWRVLLPVWLAVIGLWFVIMLRVVRRWRIISREPWPRRFGPQHGADDVGSH